MNPSEQNNSSNVLTICDLTTGSFLSLAIALATPTLLGRLAGSHVRNFKGIFNNLTIKPSFLPPKILFKPIWTVLYLCMGLASYLIFQSYMMKNIKVASALAFYSIQLLFNLCWPALFFRYRNYKVSLYIITVNLITAIITTSKFYRINQYAGYLMVPYLAWLVISGYANKRVWTLNKENVKVLVGKKSNYKRYNSDIKNTPNVCPKCYCVKQN
ncbi:hypothetical protein K502DRAFT_87107 [Neoconidiobolus thromboides FSU 785]|nr:hypothetical protein K502DRAFT_87107 [Neoconidiobolus thromboides FSU 785]